jgi:hypothetical protein
MDNVATSETSLFGLIGHLRDEIKTLIQEEIQLAKAEMSEKLSRLGRSAGLMAAGGIAALAGLIILLASLSSLLSFAFERAGLDRSLAFFLGALVIGGGAALGGLIFVTKALKTFSEESLAPEKTLHTLKEIKPGVAHQTHQRPVSTAHLKRSSDEIEASIITTRKEAGQTAEEISERLTPRYMVKTIGRKIQAHPVRAGVIGAGTGLLSFLMIWRRRHARA